MNGRPLRFVGLAAAAWVSVRTFLLWPGADPAEIPEAILPAAFADDAPDPAPVRTTHPAMATPARVASYLAALPRRRERSVTVAEDGGTTLSAAPPPRIVTSPPSFIGPIVAPRLADPVGSQPAPLPIRVITPPARVDRWSASAWFVLRNGRGIATGPFVGQLGGSQTGVRVAYLLSASYRVSAVGRVVTPLKGMGREAAIGAEWQPTRLPVRLFAEYRVALDGGRGGPAAGVVGGSGPAPLALGFDLETYGQAGVVRRARNEPFADGAARLSRPVVRLGPVKVDLGLGGWGGVQRGTSRLDFGPSLGARVPVGSKAIRLSLDWRQRVLGDARPGSGPVLVIGSDF